MEYRKTQPGTLTTGSLEFYRDHTVHDVPSVQTAKRVAIEPSRGGDTCARINTLIQYSGISIVVHIHETHGVEMYRVMAVWQSVKGMVNVRYFKEGLRGKVEVITKILPWYTKFDLFLGGE